MCSVLSPEILNVCLENKHLMETWWGMLGKLLLSCFMYEMNTLQRVEEEHCVSVLSPLTSICTWKVDTGPHKGLKW